MSTWLETPHLLAANGELVNQRSHCRTYRTYTEGKTKALTRLCQGSPQLVMALCVNTRGHRRTCSTTTYNQSVQVHTALVVHWGPVAVISSATLIAYADHLAV